MAKKPELYYEIQPDVLRRYQQQSAPILANQPQLSQYGGDMAQHEAASRNYFAQYGHLLHPPTRQRVTHLAISPGLAEMRRILRMRGRSATVQAAAGPKMEPTALAPRAAATGS